MNRIKEAEKEIFKVPGSTYVYCECCHWKGILSDCETAMDSEGWEYQEYEVLVCPKCSEYSIVF